MFDRITFRTQRRIALTIAFVLLVLTLAFTMPGCTPGGIRPDIAATFQQELDAAEQRLRVALETATEEQANEIGKALAEIARIRGMVNAAITDTGDIDATAVGGMVGAALPPPWNIVGLIGIPLVVGAVQQWRKNQETAAAKSIVNAIDVLRMESPEASQAMMIQRDKIHRALNDRAKAIIEAERLT